MNGLGVGLVASLHQGENAGQANPVVKLDPDGLQAREADARVTVACLPALDAVSDIWVTGEVAVESLLTVSRLSGCEGFGGRID
jgi:hypothetical protein